MPLTPVEIRHIDLRRAWFRGYRRRAVDALLTEIADSFEEVWRERADLSDRLEELESEASKHRELEALLRSTLVSAERAAQDMKEQARRESDLIVQEAHAESRRVVREASAEKRRLEDDVVKIRAQLRAAFESLGEWPGGRRARRRARARSRRRHPRSARRPTAGSAKSPASARSLELPQPRISFGPWRARAPAVAHRPLAGARDRRPTRGRLEGAHRGRPGAGKRTRRCYAFWRARSSSHGGSRADAEGLPATRS